MTDRRDPAQKLLRDVVRFKRERDLARATLELQRVVLVEMQRAVIAERLRGRLLRLEDFQRFIGLENVLASDGRIDDRELEVRLGDLLRRRPELAAPPRDAGAA
jgi:hypothetical protein